MSTRDLQRLERVERLLESALHDADPIPVDVHRGRARLSPRLVEQQRAVRRRWVISLASVLALVVTAAIVVSGLSGEKDSLPIAPSPELTFTSSGLPVGLLVGKVDRTEPQATSTVRMTVRPDGTGVFNAGTVGDSEGDSTADLPVKFMGDGPGSVVLTQFASMCIGREFLTLHFTVRGRSLIIEDASTPTTGCPIPRGLVSDLAGTTMRILPPPGT
jgi:hypothetical protein